MVHLWVKILLAEQSHATISKQCIYSPTSTAAQHTEDRTTYNPKSTHVNKPAKNEKLWPF
jgi:hypothetical protein